MVKQAKITNKNNLLEKETVYFIRNLYFNYYKKKKICKTVIRNINLCFQTNSSRSGTRKKLRLHNLGGSILPITSPHSYSMQSFFVGHRQLFDFFSMQSTSAPFSLIAVIRPGNFLFSNNTITKSPTLYEAHRLQLRLHVGYPRFHHCPLHCHYLTHRQNP